MKRIFRIVGVIVLVGAVAGLAFLGWLLSAPGPMGFAGGTRVELAAYRQASPTGVPAELASASPLARGEYLTRAADCEACHSKKGAPPFSGGRAFVLPFGTIYTPNLTPDRETGIGKWTDAEFVRAVHKGVGRNGEKLYPAFPFASYTALTDADVLAIKSYLFSLKPVRKTIPANSLMFPFNQRPLMGIWAMLFNSDRRFRPVAERSAAWNRGAYLVEAAGHCGECHTPRTLAQNLDNRRKFAGGAAEGWNAYNISADGKTGIGDWSDAELVQYLHAGFAPGRGIAGGPMGEAVSASLSHLTQSDLAAIVTYLRTVPARSSHALRETAPPAPEQPRLGASDNPVGKRIFEGACASCHAWTGTGALVAEAQLTGSRSVNDPSAANVAHMILAGTGTPKGGSPYMPSFASSYSSSEVAAVANYVTARFGRTVSRVTPHDVDEMRKGK